MRKWETYYNSAFGRFVVLTPDVTCVCICGYDFPNKLALFYHIEEIARRLTDEPLKCLACLNLSWNSWNFWQHQRSCTPAPEEEALRYLGKDLISSLEGPS